MRNITYNIMTLITAFVALPVADMTADGWFDLTVGVIGLLA
jgi:hypothetical protein